MTARQNPVLKYTEALLSQPHLISVESFDVIREYLELRNLGQLIKVDPNAQEQKPKKVIADFDSDSQIGVIDIEGTLTAKPVYTICGAVGTSYEDILEQQAYLIDNGAKTIILNIDSGGGEAFSCFTSVDEFRKRADDAGVEVYAYVGAMAASAAYAWAVMADEVIAHPDSTTGSIGVLIALMNDSKALEQRGLIRTFITAGDSKVPFDKDGAFKEDFLADLQTRVDALYENFVAHVAKYSTMSTETIKDTQAKTFMASDALSLGLINQVMTEYAFTDYIVNKQKGQQ